jgi:hypothetical protein
MPAGTRSRGQNGTLRVSAPADDNTYAPVVSNVTIEQEHVFPGFVASCSYEYQDADGNPDASAVEWFIDGLPVEGSGSEISVPAGTRGSVLECRVVPTDGTKSGTELSDTRVIWECTATARDGIAAGASLGSAAVGIATLVPDLISSSTTLTAALSPLLLSG